MEDTAETALRQSGNGCLHNGKMTEKEPTMVSTTGTFMKLKTYLLALRPWSLSASLVPTLLGSALAFRSQWSADFSFVTFFLTAFTVVTVHCAGNVVNTYFDFIKGIDKQKADDRTLVDHILTKDEVSRNKQIDRQNSVFTICVHLCFSCCRWCCWALFYTWLVVLDSSAWPYSVRPRWSISL